MIQYVENFDDDSTLPFVIHPQGDPARGQVQFCHILFAILFLHGNSPCLQNFPEVKIIRQVLVHKDYLRVTPLATDTTPLKYNTNSID